MSMWIASSFQFRVKRFKRTGIRRGGVPGSNFIENNLLNCN